MNTTKLDLLNTTLNIVNAKVDRVLGRIERAAYTRQRERWLSLLTDLLRLKKVLSHAAMIIELDMQSVHVRVYNSALKEAVVNTTPYLVHWEDFYTLISCSKDSIDIESLKDESLQSFLSLALEEL